MARNKCIVPLCSSRGCVPGINYFRCMQWVQNTGNQKLLQDFSLGGAQLFVEKYICCDHFSNKDFEIFGQPDSGLRNHAVPVITNLKKEPEARNMTNSSNVKEDIALNSSLVDAPPVTTILKDEPSDTESKFPVSLIEPEDSKTTRHESNAASLIKNLKREPEFMDLPESSIDEEDAANDSSSYDIVPVIAIIKEEPDEIDSTLAFPLINSEDENMSVGRLTNNSKIEEIDIEEVLLPESFSDDDDMEMEAAEDQLKDLPEHYEGVEVPRKEKSLERKKKDAQRQAMARRKETPRQRALRLEKTRVRAQERRQSESQVDTTIRRYKSAVRAAIKRSRETEEEKRLRQEKNKIRAAERRKNMSSAERKEWREKNRVQTKERREKESEIKKIVRRYNNAVRASIKRSSESPEQRMERRLKDALRAAERRKLETPEERQERLRKDRERITLRRLQMLMSETPEQREARLKKERERMYRKRHGLTEDISTEPSNEGSDSQHGSEESFQSLSAILSMYPPNIEIQTQDDAEVNK